MQVPVTAPLEFMGQSIPSQPVSMDNYSNELIRQVQRLSEGPVVGMGHSAGAVVTLIAASKRPDLFQKLVLLDPVVLAPSKRLMLGMAKLVGAMDRLTPAGRASKRKADFDSRAAAAAYLSAKSLFRAVHPECFDDYIRFGFQNQAGLPDDNGPVTLTIPREVEANVFRNLLLRVPHATHRLLKHMQVTLVYGKNSELFNKPEVLWWKKYASNLHMVEFDGGHLFPLEQPDETAELLNRLLANH